MPKGIAKGGKAKKTTQKKTVKKLAEKIEKISDTIENLAEDIQELEEAENQPTETLDIEEIATPTLQPVVEEDKTSPRAENDRLNAENANLKAQGDSRRKELSTLEFNISEREKNLSSSSSDLQVQILKNEVLLKNLQEESNKNREILTKIEESTDIARNQSKDHADKMKELNIINNLIAENSGRLDYFTGVARAVIATLREETIKYVQRVGMTIQIDHLTEEMKEEIAKTLAPQICKLSEVEERVYN